MKNDLQYYYDMLWTVIISYYPYAVWKVIYIYIQRNNIRNISNKLYHALHQSKLDAVKLILN